MFFQIEVLLLLISVKYSIAVDYYVLSEKQTHSERKLTCPGTECHTLDYYTGVGASLLSNQNNVSLFFFEGLHTSRYQLCIENSEQVLLTTLLHKSSDQSAELSTVGARLWNITNLYINKLTIQGIITTWDIYTDLGTFNQLSIMFKEFRVKGRMLAFNNSTFIFSRLQPCLSYRAQALHHINSTEILFSQVSFIQTNVSNTKLSCAATSWSPLYLIFLNCSVQNQAPFVELNQRYDSVCIKVENSKIEGHMAFSFSGAHNKLIVNMSNCHSNSQNEEGLIKFGSNLGARSTIAVYLNNYHLSSKNKLIEPRGAFVTFSRNFFFVCSEFTFTMINSTIAKRNTVLFFHIESAGADLRSCISRYKITIINTQFISNAMGIFVLLTYYHIMNVDFSIAILTSEFISNQQVMHIESNENELRPSSSIVVALKGTKLIENKVKDNNFAGVLRVVEITALVIRECEFIANLGTAVVIVESSIFFEGHNIFINNTGEKGGALALDYSTIYMGNFSTLLFADNTANQFGGAIYVRGIEKASYNCFAKTVSRDLPLWISRSIKFLFMNNFALRGGDNIYGTGLQRPCNSNARVLYSVFKFIFKNVSLSSISSNPTRVCLCDDLGTPQCINVSYIFKQLPPRYPGELFTVPIVIVGKDMGTVQGVAYASVLQQKKNDVNAEILNTQHVQEIADHRKCSSLELTIQSKETRHKQTIQLTAGQTLNSIDKKKLSQKINVVKKLKQFAEIGDMLLTLPVFLTVFLEDCPVGFNLTNKRPYICTCHQKLVEVGITVCTITNHTGLVFRSGTIWISSIDNHESDSFVIHQYCPHSFCNPDNISIDLRSPDTQCVLNHSGVLCGSCQENHSLILGSSRCVPCDNRHVPLLIAFILAGIILVIFIKALDLTVTKGTINGLIFFVNIVWTNRSILFPAPEPPSWAFKILHIFFAWLNLDLGIETCFFSGLNAYWKTWMQFLFPIYIWSISGVIIIVSRYSTKASKIFGNNSVPVLATLILLSYTKLLRTIITAFSFSVLKYPNSTHVVWSFDGNIAYFGAPHAILFLTSLTALLILWLPFTSVLLTYQCLRRKSHLRPLHWVNRWRPFFDAYLGQLKPKHQYWVGLLLVVRVLLLTLFAVTSAVIPIINILAIAIVGVCLLIHGWTMYMSFSLSVLETSFIINLTILAFVKPYTQTAYRADVAVTYTSLTIVFLQFIAIVIYHFYCQAKYTYITYKRRHTLCTSESIGREMRIVPQAVQIQYREPLLESVS